MEDKMFTEDTTSPRRAASPVRIADPSESKMAVLLAALQHYACDCESGRCEFSEEEGRESNPGCGRTAQVALRELVR
jgi:hypothetical protein